MKYELIIFDLDNTIFDFTKAETFALENTLSTLNIFATEDLKNSYFEINSSLWNDFKKGFISVDKLKSLRFSEFCIKNALKEDPVEMNRIYLQNLGKTDFLIKGAFSLIKELSKKCTLATITNGFSNVQKPRLKKTGLSELFEYTIISEEVGVAKPDFKIFKILLDEANFKDKTKVLMIGDELNSDIAGANNFKIDSCWFNPHKISLKNNDVKPEYIVSNYNEIRKIIYNGRI